TGYGLLIMRCERTTCVGYGHGSARTVPLTSGRRSGDEQVGDSAGVGVPVLFGRVDDAQRQGRGPCPGHQVVLRTPDVLGSRGIGGAVAFPVACPFRATLHPRGFHHLSVEATLKSA